MISVHYFMSLVRLADSHCSVPERPWGSTPSPLTHSAHSETGSLCCLRFYISIAADKHLWEGALVESSLLW